MQTYNEFNIILILYCLMHFTDFVNDPGMRNTWGGVYITVLLIFTMVHFIFIGIDTCHNYKLRIKQFWMHRAILIPRYKARIRYYWQLVRLKCKNCCKKKPPPEISEPEEESEEEEEEKVEEAEDLTVDPLANIPKPKGWRHMLHTEKRAWEREARAKAEREIAERGSHSHRGVAPSHNRNISLQPPPPAAASVRHATHL